uniref:uncharacterized protein LOC122597378 n=1 Tax=Erigeron canadensis TaxID=72917 RepID=UPI001CB8A9C8|nr:uncharacterized protein LOC122597378 [Erigeron canadensis]
MAVDVCSSSEPFISPRISFSHDLKNQSSQIATTIASTATATTFDFSITSNLLQPIISADELFFEGVLLPTPIKKPENLQPNPKSLVSKVEVVEVQRKRLKELILNDSEEQEKPSSRSLWKFTRTTSLNSDNAKGPKRLFRSLSLKRLLHGNSSESPPDTKGNEDIKVVQKPNSEKETTTLPRCSSLIHTPRVNYNCKSSNSPGRPVTKKNYNNNGTKIINPALNISPTNNMKLFGLGSLFCTIKPRNKTK